MTWVTDTETIRRLVVPNKFCTVVTDVDDLREAEKNLMTMEEESSDYSTNIRQIVRRVLESRVPEDQKSIVFLRVNSPQGHDKPVLIAVLFPDLAFQISELEALYGFSVNEILDLDPERDHFVLYQDCVFIDLVGTFMLLMQEYPRLVLALVYALVLRDEHEKSRLTEWIHGVIQDFREVPLLAPDQVHHQCISILTDARSFVEIDEDYDELKRLIYDAFDTILADEAFVWERFYEKLVIRHEEDQVRCLDKQSRQICRIIRRLEALLDE